MIKINNLSKTFVQGKVQVNALKNINVHINKGDVFGIIGISGAGKSTLLRCLSALEKPSSGEIEIEGIRLSDARNSNLAKIRKEMGVVFQGYNLMMQKTVGENIGFPLKIRGVNNKEIEAQVEKLLEIVDLADKKDFYPSQLSGGQKQRVAIARALATQPKILLCDEPTSALDPLTTRQVLNLLKDINENLGVTVVIITHEIDVVETICNRMAVIADGEIAEAGEVKDIFANPHSEITKLLLNWRV